MTTEDKLAFLDASQSAAPTAENGTTPAPVPALAPEPAKPDQGNQPPTAPNASGTPPVTPEAPKADGHSVPLPKYLDTYNEAKELKKRVAEFEAKERERQAAAQNQPPDPALDPDGYRKYLSSQLQRESQGQIQDLKFNMSEQMARQSLGDAVVTEAFQAFEAKAATDPFLAQRILNTQHPYAEIVKWHKQEQLLSQIGDNPDDFVKRRWAELNPVVPAGGSPPPSPQAPAPVVMPVPSMNRAPSAPKPSQVPVGPGQGFDTVFGS